MTLVRLLAVGVCVGATPSMASGCRAWSPTRILGYEACSVCFESSEPLSRLRTQGIDSCVFRFRGNGLYVHGEHSGFVPDPRDAGWQRTLSNGGWTSRGSLADGEGEVLELYLPSGPDTVPLRVAVEYQNAEAAALRIVSTVRRCRTPPM